MTAPALADRVKETTATAGTGTVTLAGAAAGYRAFNGAITSGGTCYYCLESGTDWEVGIGTFTHGGSDTLSRDTVLASSAGGTTKITLAGTSNVFVTRPAAAIVPAASAADLPVVTHSGGATLDATSRGALHQFNGSSASTATYTAPATLGAGWWCIVENALTGTTGLNQTLTHTPASGNIDGVATGATYPGSQLLVQCDGSNFNVVLLRGGFCQLLTADSPFTYKTAIGAKRFFVEQWPGGGSGGSGLVGAASGQRSGGGGGAGGACVTAWFKSSDLGSSITCTIAAAQSSVGTGSGGVGSAGNNTTFGSLLTAYAGGGGAAGAAGNTVGGSGGGSLTIGVTGSNVGGGPSATGASGQFGGASGGSGNVGLPAYYGGAGGGGSANNSSSAGGCAVKGGAGGGAGGGVSSSNVAANGGAGGSGQGAISAGGGSAGSAGTTGVDGASPSSPSGAATTLGAGLGGGGGGAGFDNTGGGTASNGGTGANGGIAAGGGGGGSAMTGKTSGNGGQGGPGLIRVWDFP